MADNLLNPVTDSLDRFPVRRIHFNTNTENKPNVLMTKHASMKATWAASILALAAPSFVLADIKVNDSLTLNGWATASYDYTKPSPGSYTDSFNVDAALLGAVITPTKGLTSTVSVLYRPSAEGGVSPGGSEATLLDAFVTYDAGGGLTITGGKFLSYLGYESFYFINDNMITLANQQFLAPIPGYHEGIKFDYAADKTVTVGAALVDALYQKPGYAATAADGEFKHNGGVEGYVQYTGVSDLTLWAGFGYQSKTKPGIDTSGVVVPSGNAITVVDVWASYQINKVSALALEEIYKDGGTGNKGSNWLGYYQYNFSDKVSSWFSVGGETVSDGGPSYTKYSISPNYAINANLSLRAQYSYTKYSKFSINNANFFGVEALFKF